MDEKSLVKSAKAGDKDAFCDLYALYKDRLYRYAYYKLGNAEDAQDAVQDCIVSAYVQMKNIRNASAFSSWIFSILHATCTKYVKLQIKQRENKSLESTNLIFNFNQESHELLSVLEQLNQDEQDIILLSIVAGFTSKEISKVMEITPGSVRSKLSRSLAKMRNILE